MSGVAMADLFGFGLNQFDINFMNISGNTNPISGYGFVNNDCRMGIYEINNGQWNKFLASYGTVTGSPSNAYDESFFWKGTNVSTNGVYIILMAFLTRHSIIVVSRTYRTSCNRRQRSCRKKNRKHLRDVRIPKD